MKPRLLDDLPESFDGWLWKDMKIIPRNELTAVIGFDGVGKTSWVLSLAALLSAGKISGKPEMVFFSMQEDSEAMTKARLKIHQAEPWNCLFQPYDKGGVFAHPWTFPDDLEVFETYLVATGTTVAIINSLGYHVDSLSGQRARQTLGALREIAVRNSITIIVIGHFNKSGRDLNEAIGGGRGVKATMRCILIWGECPPSYMLQFGANANKLPPEETEEGEDDPWEDFEDATHVLAVHKNSYGQKFPEKQSWIYQANQTTHPFDPMETVLQFDNLGQWPVSPQQVFRPGSTVVGRLTTSSSGAPSGGGPQSAKATELLLQALTFAGDAWVRADELQQFIINAGVSEKTVAVARSQLAKEGLIENRRDKGVWWWRIKPFDLPTTDKE